MTTPKTRRAALERYYQKAADDYMAGLPLEHYMESPPHATQRKISWDSLDLLAKLRTDVHVYNELLVQYPKAGRKRPGQVVPDNMVVLHDGLIKLGLSYNTPFVKPRPFWVLEYVSKNTTRKDYIDNKRRYERDLKIPYYLLFDPLKQKLTLYRHTGKRYETGEPNEAGRLDLRELDLEMAILDGWVRFWHQGKLLPLPAELQNELDDTKKDLADTRKDLSLATKRAEAAERELARLREQIAKPQTKKNGSS